MDMGKVSMSFEWEALESILSVKRQGAWNGSAYTGLMCCMQFILGLHRACQGVDVHRASRTLVICQARIIAQIRCNCVISARLLYCRPNRLYI